jgi:hypothetical protein
MPAIDCTDAVDIRAGAAEVYARIVDYPGWQDWNPVYRCEWIDGDGPAEGVKVRHRYGYPPFIMSRFVRSIDRLEPGKRLEESYIEGDLIGTGVWTFDEHEGVTTVAYHCRVRSNSLLAHLSLAVAGEGGHSGVYQKLLGKLKVLCES